MSAAPLAKALPLQFQAPMGLGAWACAHAVCSSLSLKGKGGGFAAPLAKALPLQFQAPTGLGAWACAHAACSPLSLKGKGGAQS